MNTFVCMYEWVREKSCEWIKGRMNIKMSDENDEWKELHKWEMTEREVSIWMSDFTYMSENCQGSEKWPKRVIFKKKTRTKIRIEQPVSHKVEVFMKRNKTS